MPLHHIAIAHACGERHHEGLSVCPADGHVFTAGKSQPVAFDGDDMTTVDHERLAAAQESTVAELVFHILQGAGTGQNAALGMVEQIMILDFDILDVA